MPAASPDRFGRRVSLRDVAAEAGVSHVAVSLALRGSARVSPAQREKIAAIAARLGYRPDPMLSSLAAYRQARHPAAIRSTIAWINLWPNPADLRRFHEFDAYWHGASELAARLGYRLEEIIVDRPMSPARLQQVLRARDVRGILIPPHAGGFTLPDFDWSQFSVVRFGASVRQVRAHLVTSDQMNCAVMAFERVRELGYRRIGYVTSQRLDRNTGGNFRAGYLTAQSAQVPLRSQLPPLSLGEEGTDSDVRALRRWRRAHRPDAVITTLANLSQLLAALACAVPEDLGVAALSVLDGHFDAGVDQNSREVGRVAMATLAGLIQQNERGLPQFSRRILVEGRWVDGSSLPDRRK